MKKKVGLVFTGLKENFFYNAKNLLLNKSCSVSDFDKKKSKNFEYCNKKESDIIKTSKICNFYYERLLEDLVINLKNFYKVNWNKRSWEIFLGPWLHRYISVLHDRYYSLEFALKKNKITDIKVCNDIKFNLLTQDQLEFRQINQSDEWNFKLYSKLYLNFFKKKEISLQTINFKNKKKRYSDLVNFKKDKKIILRIFFNKIFFSFVKKFINIIFYKTYFGNKKFIFLLTLLKKSLPFTFDFEYEIPKSNSINKQRNKKIISKYQINKFEKVLRDLLFELLPFYYLEKLSYINMVSDSLILPSHENKKIYTASCLWSDNIFKFWLANAISKNSKLYHFQHGCNYGNTKYSYAEDLEVKLSNKFYSWGWKSKTKKIKKLFAVKLINKNIKNLKNSNKILIVGSVPLKYISGLTSGAYYGHKSEEYLSFAIKVLNLFSTKYKSGVYFRPFPTESYNSLLEKLSLENYVKKKFKNIKIDNSSISFYNSIQNYGLIIHTFDGTSFLETMALNKPTILLMKKNLMHHRKSALKYYGYLKKCNILHTNLNSLIKFLDKTDLNYWWNNLTTKAYRKKFSENFCYNPKNKLLELDKKLFN